MQVVEEAGKARVVFVAQGGPAQRAGLAVGDSVLALNGQPVELHQKQYGPSCKAASRWAVLRLETLSLADMSADGTLGQIKHVRAQLLLRA